MTAQTAPDQHNPGDVFTRREIESRLRGRRNDVVLTENADGRVGFYRTGQDVHGTLWFHSWTAVATYLGVRWL